jgi:hypothetical protein
MHGNVSVLIQMMRRGVLFRFYPLLGHFLLEVLRQILRATMRRVLKPNLLVLT